MRHLPSVQRCVHLGLLLLLCGGAVALVACTPEEVLSPGDEGFEPLALSSPGEVVARTLRLAGIEEVAAGRDGGVAEVRAQMPSVNSAADVELVWQAGVAALSVAYPGAGEYVVRVGAVEELLEVRVDGAEARGAVADDDANALKRSAEFVLLGEGVGPPPPGEFYIVETDESGAYLDAKNRAVDLYGVSCSIVSDAEQARAAVPGVPAVPAGAAAAATWAGRATEVLAAEEIEGAEGLADRLSAFGSGAEPGDVEAARAWYHTAVAAATDDSFGSVLADVAAHAERAATAEIPSGPDADAVLVAAQSPDAPEAARDATGFEPLEQSAETTEPAASLPDLVLEIYGTDGALRYRTADGPVTVEAVVWVPVEREDGTVYHLPGEDASVALTDGTVDGWAFSRKQAVLVDATDVGEWLEVYPLP